MKLSRDQCRAARALLDWTQDDLSKASTVTQRTIADFERGARAPRARTLRDLGEAFRAAGIEFLDGDAPGLRLRPKKKS